MRFRLDERSGDWEKERWRERDHTFVILLPFLLGESKGCCFLAAQNVFNHCPSYCGRWSVMPTIPLLLNLCLWLFFIFSWCYHFNVSFLLSVLIVPFLFYSGLFTIADYMPFFNARFCPVKYSSCNNLNVYLSYTSPVSCFSHASMVSSFSHNPIIAAQINNLHAFIYLFIR